MSTKQTIPGHSSISEAIATVTHKGYVEHLVRPFVSAVVGIPGVAAQCLHKGEIRCKHHTSPNRCLHTQPRIHTMKIVPYQFGKDIGALAIGVACNRPIQLFPAEACTHVYGVPGTSNKMVLAVCDRHCGQHHRG